MRDTKDHLIVALDVPSLDELRQLCRLLQGEVGMVKIGLGHLGYGLHEAVDIAHQYGHKIFLDLKLFDIGATVSRAVEGLCQLPIDMLTVHGDPHVVRAAFEGRARGQGKFSILAVTILTSLDAVDIDACQFAPMPVELLVEKRAQLAVQAGADGVIASPAEAKRLRELLGPSFYIVTPGVRPHGADQNDQKRVATPRDAIQAGASHIVVGRPIIHANDPLEATRNLLLPLAGMTA